MNAQQLADSGWHQVAALDLPPQNDLVEFRREGEHTPWIYRWCNLPDGFDTHRLWWRKLPN